MDNKMHQLVMIRHGQSEWNRDNRFTGWTDIDLTEKGVAEARQAGALLRGHGFIFDVAFTSVLKRAIRTLWLILDEMDLMWIPVHYSWRLNERHYGALQGLNKKETAQTYGSDQVHIWRRSYDTRPPLLEQTDVRHPRHDHRYSYLSDEELPQGESLKDTLERVLPCWRDSIVPVLQSGRRLVISAHGNSLRALIKFLDNISDEDIVSVEVPTGVPLIYELNADLTSRRHYYLGETPQE